MISNIYFRNEWHFRLCDAILCIQNIRLFN